MNWRCFIGGLILIPCAAMAGTLPTVTIPPVSQITSVGSNATFSVTATGATGYQWRFNGADIPGGNASTYMVTNAQATNAGYYSVLAQNATGWVPGGMAYLSVLTGPDGIMPFNNQYDTNSAVITGYNCEDFSQPYVTNGTAQIVAGPQLDQMQPVAGTAHVRNHGVFSSSNPQTVPIACIGQTIYYRVDVTSSNAGCGTFIQSSAVLSYLITNDLSTFPPPVASPSFTCTGLQFPNYDEWPTPYFIPPYAAPVSTTNDQIVALGETMTFENYLFDDLLNVSPVSVQWRKDGVNIPGATNLVPAPNQYGVPSTSITISNVQPEDAGVYDIVAVGMYQPAISFKFTLAVQVTNGQGLLQSPRTSGSKFFCDLAGIASRQYDIQWSTNLTDWYDLQTVANNTGTVTFSNSIAPSTMKFYRTKLVPYLPLD